MNIIVTLLLFATSLGIFFGFTKPQYEKITDDISLRDQYAQVLTRMETLKNKSNELAGQYSAIPKDGILKINQALPDSNDSVQTIMTIQKLAARNGVTLTNAGVDAPKDSTTASARKASTMGESVLTFKAQAPYTSIVKFLGEVERNLRLIDIQSLSVVGDEKAVNKNGYEVDVSLVIHWTGSNAGSLSANN
ncbi:MAG: hypothetical protein WC757_00515 [Candidatus Paceibacterota bacterium]|jgi:hypothetical protein